MLSPHGCYEMHLCFLTTLCSVGRSLITSKIDPAHLRTPPHATCPTLHFSFFLVTKEVFGTSRKATTTFTLAFSSGRRN